MFPTSMYGVRAIAANEKAQGDRKMEIETEKLEQKTNAIDAGTDKVGWAAPTEPA